MARVTYDDIQQAAERWYRVITQKRFRQEELRRLCEEERAAENALGRMVSPGKGQMKMDEQIQIWMCIDRAAKLEEILVVTYHGDDNYEVEIRKRQVKVEHDPKAATEVRGG